MKNMWYLDFLYERMKNEFTTEDALDALKDYRKNGVPYRKALTRSLLKDERFIKNGKIFYSKLYKECSDEKS